MDASRTAPGLFPRTSTSSDPWQFRNFLVKNSRSGPLRRAASSVPWGRSSEYRGGRGDGHAIRRRGPPIAGIFAEHRSAVRNLQLLAHGTAARPEPRPGVETGDAERPPARTLRVDAAEEARRRRRRTGPGPAPPPPAPRSRKRDAEQQAAGQIAPGELQQDRRVAVDAPQRKRNDLPIDRDDAFAENPTTTPQSPTLTGRNVIVAASSEGRVAKNVARDEQGNEHA